MNSCFPKEESERIGLLSQLNIEKVSVEWLKSVLKEWRKKRKDNPFFIGVVRTMIQDNEERSQLPDGITVRKVRFTFLQKQNKIQYMKYFNMYDPDKSLNDNCITFLKRMEAENRLGDLWLEINK